MPFLGKNQEMWIEKATYSTVKISFILLSRGCGWVRLDWEGSKVWFCLQQVKYGRVVKEDAGQGLLGPNSGFSRLNCNHIAPQPLGACISQIAIQLQSPSSSPATTLKQQFYNTEQISIMIMVSKQRRDRGIEKMSKVCNLRNKITKEKPFSKRVFHQTICW